jgi:cytidylate kinase
MGSSQSRREYHETAGVLDVKIVDPAFSIAGAQSRSLPGVVSELKGCNVPIVTISRGSFSGGKAIAEGLAQKLGFRCIDRDIIVERASAGGVSQFDLIAAIDKPPSLLDRFRHKKYIYLALFQAALTEEVRTGRVVYHGNAGHLLLMGARPVLRVRIIAPLEMRIEMCRQRLKYTPEEAIRHIQKMDQDRRKWTQFLYGVDWGKPELYDIVLNLERADIEEACELLAGVVRRQSCYEFGTRCQQEMNDLALACRLKADLALDPATADLEVEVTSSEGEVRVQGQLSTPTQIREIQRVAGAVAGITKLILDGVG